MSPSYAVIGVDIGGTKTKAGAVEVKAQGLGQRVLAAQQIPTPRAAPAVFYDAIARLIDQVQTQARHAGTNILPLIAVAHPGRFLADGTLARGTTPNLGTTPNQFDGAKPAAELTRRLRAQVVAENDAVAQMRLGLDVLLRDPTARAQLLGHTVVYLGPGTGMGGGVARVGANGVVTPVTDGHLFDMQVPGIGDGTRTAEELFTGPAIARRVAAANVSLRPPIEPATAGQLNHLLLTREALPSHVAAARQLADEHGDVLAAIIEAIHAGRITKVRLEPRPDGRLQRHADEPDRAWSAADRRLVRGVRRYLFGGFVGCSVGLGRRIRDRALDQLRRRGLPDMEIFQIPVSSDDAGMLGIVHAIPLEAIRASIT